MKIFLLYAITGGIYFFQTYFSFSFFDTNSNLYGLRSFAILGSFGLFSSGFLFLFFQSYGSLLCLVSSTIIFVHLLELLYQKSITYKFDLFSYFSLSILLLSFVHSFLYLLLNKDRLDNKFKNSYFPEKIDRRVSTIVGSACTIVSVGIISIIILFTNVSKEIEKEVTWKLEDIKNNRSKKVLLIFQAHPNYFIEFFSDKLAEKLIENRSSITKLKVIFTLDFGRLKGYKILSIDNEPIDNYGFYNLSMECGNGFPECIDKPIPPWEGK